MEFENTPEKPLMVPGEVTQKIVDSYSASIIRQIFKKVKIYYDNQKEGRLDAHLFLEPQELLLIERYCTDKHGDEIHVETPKECVIGKGDKQLKVNLGVFHKMKERKLISEVKSHEKVVPTFDDTNSYGEPKEENPVIHNMVNKNAYEIRLDVLKEATQMAPGDPQKALQIAESFYKFVENKRRL